MLIDNIKNELNKQLNREFYSSYLYLAISSWCSQLGYKGSASWFMIQSEEERNHALKIYNYLLDQGCDIQLLSIDNPKTDYSALLECFEESLSHEQKMSNSFNELCDLAIKEKDHASYGFLQWFVQEQIEEESTVSEIIAKLRLVDNGNGIFLIDSQLAQRQVEPNNVA